MYLFYATGLEIYNACKAHNQRRGIFNSERANNVISQLEVAQKFWLRMVGNEGRETIASSFRGHSARSRLLVFVYEVRTCLGAKASDGTIWVTLGAETRLQIDEKELVELVRCSKLHYEEELQSP